MLRASRLTVAVVAVFLAFPAVSFAATYTVNTTADNPPTVGECSGVAGDCSIRQAADKAVSGDTISIPASASPYLVAVANGFIVIPGGVTVTGTGASEVTVSGQGTSQIFAVESPGTTTFENLTLANANNSTVLDESGAITANRGGDPTIVVTGVVFSNDVSHLDGGAIEQTGTGNLTVSDSSFVNDAATTGFGGAIDYYSSGTLAISSSVFAGSASPDGGAIEIEDEPAASTISASTFSGNSATDTVGGAIETSTGSGVTVSNSTFTGNSATTNGGAISVLDGGMTSLINDTLTANTAPAAANVDNESGGTFATENSIFASPGGGGANCAGGGTFTDNGNNLEDTSPSTCGLTTGKGNVVGESPQLASALAVNGSTVPTAGGPPQTLALSSTSPALHAASASGCSTVGSVDERNMARPGQAATACDIGAFELQYHTLSVTANGSGTVSGSGISCPGTCSKGYPETTQVSLSELPSAGHAFSGWSGDCSGLGACSVTMSANRSVTATFAASAATLKVSISGSGSVSGSGISCHHTCSKSYSSGAKVTLHARPASGFAFAGWSGDCTGKAACSLTMSADHSVKAKFVAKQLRLAVSPGKARAQTQTCFHFTVRSNGRVIGGATIHFASKTARTTRHGRALICAALPAGVHKARATKSPYRAAVFGVRITPPLAPHPTFTG